MSQMIIANRLTDGRVVFLGTDGAWVEAIADGRVAENDDAGAQLLTIARQAEADSVVVDPYLIQVRAADEAPEPLDWREMIRAKGPTVQRSRV